MEVYLYIAFLFNKINWYLNIPPFVYGNYISHECRLRYMRILSVPVETGRPDPLRIGSNSHFGSFTRFGVVGRAIPLCWHNKLI